MRQRGEACKHHHKGTVHEPSKNLDALKVGQRRLDFRFRLPCIGVELDSLQHTLDASRRDPYIQHFRHHPRSKLEVVDILQNIDVWQGPFRSQIQKLEKQLQKRR